MTMLMIMNNKKINHCLKYNNDNNINFIVLRNIILLIIFQFNNYVNITTFGEYLRKVGQVEDSTGSDVIQGKCC